MRHAPHGRRHRPSAEDIDLGSLTQRHATQRCGNCHCDRVTRVGITLTDGSPVVFTSCHLCQDREWREHDQLIAVSQVLERSRKPLRA